VTASLKGGTLHWLIQPYNSEQRPPTYGPDHATLLSFRQQGGGPAPAVPGGGAGPGRSGAPSVRLLRRSRSTVLRRRGFVAALRCPAGCTARLRVTSGGRVLARSTKRARPSSRRSARSLVRLTRHGRRVLRTRRGRLTLTLRATVREPSRKLTRHKARMRLRPRP
jgi:hypothetical protein